MVDIKFLIENPSLAKDITLQIKGSTLLQFADKLSDATAKKVEQRIKAENKPDKLLTRQQVSKIFGVNVSTLHRWESKGILIPIRLGRKVRYRNSDVEELIKKRGE